MSYTMDIVHEDYTSYMKILKISSEYVTSMSRMRRIMGLTPTTISQVGRADERMGKQNLWLRRKISNIQWYDPNQVTHKALQVTTIKEETVTLSSRHLFRLIYVSLKYKLKTSFMLSTSVIYILIYRILWLTSKHADRPLV